MSDNVCRVCKNTVDLATCTICHACGYVMHPGCCDNEGICIRCKNTHKVCKALDCIACVRGVCVSSSCHGSIDNQDVLRMFRIDVGRYNIHDRQLLYQVFSGVLHGRENGYERAHGNGGRCFRQNCVANERSICIVPICFGVISASKTDTLVERASTYDEKTLEGLAVRIHDNIYGMTCSTCGIMVECSADIARVHKYNKQAPCCKECRKGKK